MARETTQSTRRAPALRTAIRWWAEGWVLFVRSAGGRAEDLVGRNPWLAARQAAKGASNE